MATCEVARDASRRLGLPESVQTSLFHAVARWDGTGFPPAAGEAIPLSTRFMHVASTAVLFALHAGDEAAVVAVRRRSGQLLDPDLCDVFVRRSAELLDGIDELDAYESVLDAEPDPVRMVDDDGSEAVARTFGDLVDLKSPWLHGHSTGVAELAAAAAAGARPTTVRPVRMAGHLHDIGRVGGLEPDLGQARARSRRTERDQARLHAVPQRADPLPGARARGGRASSPASTTSAATAAATTGASPRAGSRCRPGCSRPRMRSGPWSRTARTAPALPPAQAADRLRGRGHGRAARRRRGAARSCRGAASAAAAGAPRPGRAH